jgi:SAM-dependent methyltransferase
VQSFLECFSHESAHRERIEKERYATLLQTLKPWANLYEKARVLDFGASSGLSLFALLETGAREVVGVEPDEARVRSGRAMLDAAGCGDRATLMHLADTSALPFDAETFDFVMCNAVLEHIPQPRGSYIREMWRVLRRGGHLYVSETPNKYVPLDQHTTGLWGVPWLPSGLARAYAEWRGRWGERREAECPWIYSGWRGLGYRELTSGLGGGYRLIPEDSRTRHRVLTRLGAPASLLDPYPTWVLEKV